MKIYLKGHVSFLQEKAEKQIFNFKSFIFRFLKEVEVTSANLTLPLQFDSFRKVYWLEQDLDITGSISFEL